MVGRLMESAADGDRWRWLQNCPFLVLCIHRWLPKRQFLCVPRENTRLGFTVHPGGCG